MPEGHTIHRLALDLAKDFEGQTLRASSPQGRFAFGADAIDGRRLTRAHAIGKHLFLDFAIGRRSARVHVHLGLFGKFRKQRPTKDGAVASPRPSVRLRLESSAATWDLAGPTACELLDPDAFETLRARLGVDPLAEGARPLAAWKRISKSKKPIGALLLDQSIFAGIGNVYRAELLFLANVHPDTPGNELDRTRFDRLWRDAKRLLRDGVKANRIVTVPPKERRSRARREMLYVYKRASCKRCDSAIARVISATRALYYCPTCQALPPEAAALAGSPAAKPATSSPRSTPR